jgi:putative ABC transport system permease protein
VNQRRLAAHALRALLRYRLRSASVMLGTLLGIAALTVVLAVGEAAERKVLTTVRQLFGTSSLLIMPGGAALMGGPRAGAARLTLDELEAVAAEVPAIVAWDPQQAMPNASVRHGDSTATARVLGHSDRWTEVWGRAVVRGEAFDAAAVAGAARVALLGETVAGELFGDADPVGAEIRIGAVPFRVVGVLERFGTDLHGMDRDDEIVVPLSTLLRRLLEVDTLGGARLLVGDPSQTAAAAEQVRAALRAQHALSVGQPDDFRLISGIETQRMVARVQRVLFVYLPLAAGVTLLVAGMVTASLMLASVRRRVGEIGLRRAVGARPRDVATQFLVETALTTFAGGLLGVGVGLLAAAKLAERFHLEGIAPWPPVAIGLAVAIVVGLLAGVGPARRAARLDPAVALRS